MKLFAGLLLIAFLFTAASISAQPAQMLELLKSQSKKLKVSPVDLQETTISSQYTDTAIGITFVYLQQWYQGIRVYNGVMSIALKNNEVASAEHSFINSLSKRVGSSPALTIPAQEAVQRSAAYLKLPALQETKLLSTSPDGKKQSFAATAFARRPVEAELVWIELNNEINLAWNVNIDVAGTDDWWNIRVDARNGSILQKDNWTHYEQEHEMQSPVAAGNHFPMPPVQQIATASPLFFPPNVATASYRVFPFPIESPAYGNEAVETSPWLKAGAANAATTHGWHHDGTTNYDITRGNNVWAYLDVDRINAANTTNNWSDTSSSSAPSLSFNHSGNLQSDPSSTSGKKQALTNLFYWNNIVHDVAYQYGFTEAAGNFQADNMGRGGSANDYVRAEAQDAGGTNNAFFTTPSDGTAGRMQLYLFSGKMSLEIAAPSSIAGTYITKENAFTSPNKLENIGPVTAPVVYYNDIGSSSHLACTSPSNTLTGKIVLIDQGNEPCSYVDRVARAQSFGAAGVIVISSTNSTFAMTGTNASITIPAVMVTYSVGSLMTAQLANGEVVNVTIAWTPRRDASLDNGVIVHEYGHGISNRLTGGPNNSSCLANAEHGGEGWSDYLSLMLTTNWSTAQLTDGAKLRAQGNFVLANGLNGTGGRRYPYSTNMSVNPLTYADMAANTQIHKIGEIWCSAIWDMTWNIIQQTGSITPDIYNSQGTGGNVIAMNLVITGMKLQKCSPGFLDSRDAILAADSILYNKAYRCAIWNAFARRGMGISAIQGSSNSASDGVAAFDISKVWLTKGNPVKVPGGSAVTLTTNVGCNCECGAPAGSLTVKDSIPTGFSYVSSTGGTLNGQEVSFPAFTLSAASPTKTFSVTVLAPAGCATDTVINDNRDGNTLGGFTSNQIEGLYNWVPSFDRAASGTYSWFARNASSTSNFTLTSAPVMMKPWSVFSFKHYYNVEGGYDGGVFELSTDGITWSDAAPYFIENGYNISMAAGSLLAGRRAFSSNSDGFIRSQLDLSSFDGQYVQLRFRMTSDNSVQLDGWYIDDILLTQGCGGLFKSSLLSAGGVVMETMVQPLFALPSSATLPLTLLQFTATKSGAQTLLQWQTTNEINTRHFVVEHSANGLQWMPTGNVQAKGQGSGSYQFIHTYPDPGKNYYRLKMVDVDDHFTYSPVRTIDFVADNSIVVFPNPANARTVIMLQQPVSAQRVQVIGTGGNVVADRQLNGTVRQVELLTQNWAPGSYMVILKTAKGILQSKLVVVH